MKLWLRFLWHECFGHPNFKSGAFHSVCYSCRTAWTTTSSGSMIRLHGDAKEALLRYVKTEGDEAARLQEGFK